METPICGICAKSEELCSGCRAKLRTGEITELDVQVSELLYKINEEHNLSLASFTRAIDLGKVVLILTKGEVGILIGRQGKVVSQLSSALGKRVRIAQHSGDVKKTIGDIITPAKLLGVNTIYSASGQHYRIRVLKSDQRVLPIDIPSLEKVLNSIMGAQVQISFE
jgi:transcription antitermination factor NusA-like protein